MRTVMNKMSTVKSIFFSSDLLQSPSIHERVHGEKGRGRGKKGGRVEKRRREGEGEGRREGEGGMKRCGGLKRWEEGLVYKEEDGFRSSVHSFLPSTHIHKVYRVLQYTLMLDELKVVIKPVYFAFDI